MKRGREREGEKVGRREGGWDKERVRNGERVGWREGGWDRESERERGIER